MTTRSTLRHSLIDAALVALMLGSMLALAYARDLPILRILP